MPFKDAVRARAASSMGAPISKIHHGVVVPQGAACPTGRVRNAQGICVFPPQPPPSPTPTPTSPTTQCSPPYVWNAQYGCCVDPVTGRCLPSTVVPQSGPSACLAPFVWNPFLGCVDQFGNPAPQGYGSPYGGAYPYGGQVPYGSTPYGGPYGGPSYGAPPYGGSYYADAPPSGDLPGPDYGDPNIQYDPNQGCYVDAFGQCVDGGTASVMGSARYPWAPRLATAVCPHGYHAIPGTHSCAKDGMAGWDLKDTCSAMNGAVHGSKCGAPLDLAPHGIGPGFGWSKQCGCAPPVMGSGCSSCGDVQSVIGAIESLMGADPKGGAGILDNLLSLPGTILSNPLLKDVLSIALPGAAGAFIAYEVLKKKPKVVTKDELPANAVKIADSGPNAAIDSSDMSYAAAAQARANAA